MAIGARRCMCGGCRPLVPQRLRTRGCPTPVPIDLGPLVSLQVAAQVLKEAKPVKVAESDVDVSEMDTHTHEHTHTLFLSVSPCRSG